MVTVILAGGYSRRMGRDKALAVWHGEPLLQRVYGVARSLTPRSIILSAWNDRYAHLELPGCEFWVDHSPGSGPLVALAQVFAACESRSQPIPSAPSGQQTHPIQQPAWVLLLACDLPSLNHDRVAQLCDRVTHCDDRTIAIVPRTDDTWEPLCALYRRTAQPQLEAFIHTGGRSFQRWLNQLAAVPQAIEAVAIAPDDRAWLHNCNTPADLERLESGSATGRQNPASSNACEPN
ncbi:MAG: molybdenum cofactor guanylyltransferase [Oscillatoriales cyanobacterium]|nr:MAG: molybdenum cofactor guanylyltransferase [Oscillatoriales cyanobacterium]